MSAIVGLRNACSFSFLIVCTFFFETTLWSQSGHGGLAASGGQDGASGQQTAGEVCARLLPFIRSDANGDMLLDMSDAIRTLDFIFLGTATLWCHDAADTNDDGAVDLSDAILTLNFQFQGGLPPSPPYPESGLDPTEDAFLCQEFSSEFCEESLVQPRLAVAPSRHYVEVELTGVAGAEHLVAANYSIQVVGLTPLEIVEARSLEAERVLLVTSSQEPVAYTLQFDREGGDAVTPESSISFQGSDRWEPYLLSATALDNTSVLVTFSEQVEKASTQDSSGYSITEQGELNSLDIHAVESLSCGPCEGHLSKLTMRYDGAATSLVHVTELGAGGGETVIHEQVHDPGDTFTVTGATEGGALTNPIAFYVSGIRSSTLSTGCSDLLDDGSAVGATVRPGLAVGDFKVMDVLSSAGGQICPPDTLMNTTVLFTTGSQSTTDYDVTVLNIRAQTDGARIDPFRNIVSFQGQDEDLVAPKLTSAVATTVNTVLLSFDEALSEGADDPTNFGVTRLEVGLGMTPTGRNAQGLLEYTHNQTGIEFVLLPGGEFQMGSPDTEEGRDELGEGPVHTVKLSPFMIAKHEVTQEEYATVMTGHATLSIEPSSNDAHPQRPVEGVSWDDLKDPDGFLARTGFSLPSEAQWEYACRAGTSGPFAGTGIAHTMGWFDANSGGSTHPVGEKQANQFGLYDMHGNVYEWCEDLGNNEFYSTPEAYGPDPVATSGPGGRVSRGGNYIGPESATRSAARAAGDANSRLSIIGFRPALALPANANAAAHVLEASLSDHGTQVTLTTSSLPSGTPLQVSASGVSDVAGNPISETWNEAFFDYDGSVDGERPSVVGAVAVSNTEVLVAFSEAMAGGLESAENPSHYRIYAVELDSRGLHGSTLSETGELMVVGAELQDPPSVVRLITLSQMGSTYKIKITNVRDRNGEILVNPEAGDADPIDLNVTVFVGVPASGAPLDQDGDGISDADEQRGWLVVVHRNDGETESRWVTSDPLLADTDGDGVTDNEEAHARTDPRSTDTDQDTISDGDEWNTVWSDPTNQDSDGDGVQDGFEFYTFRTSPSLRDTDGDGIDDADEILAGNRSPLLADLPVPGIRIGEISLSLETTLSETDESGQLVTSTQETALSSTVGSDQRFSTANETATQNTIESSLSVEAGYSAGKDGGFNYKVAAGRSTGSSRGYTLNVSQETGSSAEETYDRSLGLEQTRDTRNSLTRDVLGGEIRATVFFENNSDVAFTLSNIELVALTQDPHNHRKLVPMGTLVSRAVAEGLEDFGTVNMGVLDDSGRGPFVFSSINAFPEQIEALMKSPRGLIVRLSNYDLTDQDGQNFAYSSQEILEKTAGITFDLGDGRIETYRVATSSAHHPVTAIPLGITIRDALTRIIGLCPDNKIRDGGNGIIETDLTGDDVDAGFGRGGGSIEPGEVIATVGDNGELDSAPAGDDYIQLGDYETQEVVVSGVTKVGLSRFRDRANEVQADFEDTGDHASVWVLFSSKDLPRGYHLDNLILRAGDQLDFVYVEDRDNDGVWAREEYLHESSDGNADTDGDSLDDQQEIQDGWQVRLRGSPEVQQVYPNPVRPDSDSDGLNDPVEKGCLTDPRQQDTDLDGLTDFEEIFGVRINAVGAYSQMVTQDCICATTAEGGECTPRSLSECPDEYNPNLEQPELTVIPAYEGYYPGEEPTDPSGLPQEEYDYWNVVVDVKRVLNIVSPQVEGPSSHRVRGSLHLDGQPLGCEFTWEDLTSGVNFEPTLSFSGDGCLDNYDPQVEFDLGAGETRILRLELSEITASGEIVCQSQEWIFDSMDLGAASGAVGCSNVDNSIHIDCGAGNLQSSPSPEEINEHNCISYAWTYVPGHEGLYIPTHAYHRPLNLDGEVDLCLESIEAEVAAGRLTWPIIYRDDGSFPGGYATNPLDPDTDDDGISDFMEIVQGGDPNDGGDVNQFLDDDGDGISNFDEVNGYNGDVTVRLQNGDDISGPFFSDPYRVDSDGDGLSDLLERYLKSNPDDDDTDDDLIPDALEYQGTTQCIAWNSSAGVCVEFSAEFAVFEGACGRAPNCPGDGQTAGLMPGTAIDPHNLRNGTLLYDWDTDRDGLSDREETQLGLDSLGVYDNVFINGDRLAFPAITFTNPRSFDSDNDNLSDGEELDLAQPTNPTNLDSDGDGENDDIEVANTSYGHNPVLEEKEIRIDMGRLEITADGEVGGGEFFLEARWDGDTSGACPVTGPFPASSGEGIDWPCTITKIMTHGESYELRVRVEEDDGGLVGEVFFPGLANDNDYCIKEYIFTTASPTAVTTHTCTVSPNNFDATLPINVTISSK